MGAEHGVNKTAVAAGCWRSVPLGEAGTWLSGGTPSTSNPAYWDGDIPWISGASLKTFRIADSERRLTPLGAKTGSRLVAKGTIMFVVRGMSLKSEFRIGVAARDLAFGQDVKALIPAKGIDPYFLAYAMRAHTDQILRMVEDTSHGTGRLDTDRLQELEIGVPPLDEQRRIVAAHAAFERRIGTLEGVRAKIEMARRAAVAQAISAAWAHDLVPLKDMLQRVETGWSPVCAPRLPASDEWGVLKLSAITAGRFREDEAKALPPEVAPRLSHEVKPGDVLMSRANGVKSFVGVACTVERTREMLLIPDLVFRLVADPLRLDPEFLGFFLASHEARRQIEDAMRGSSGQYKISQADVRELLVPSVGLRKQRQAVATGTVFERRITTLGKQIAKLRTVQQAVVEDLLTGRSKASVA